MIFQQTTGARTVSPEAIGQIAGQLAGSAGNIALGPLGGQIGRKVAHEVSGFPPIWTTVRLTIFADGRFDGKVVCNSLFPSMSFYEMRAVMGAAAGKGGGTATVSRANTSYNQIGATYDARPSLDRWKTEGWGTLAPNASGPSPGNPWGYRKQDLTMRPTTSEQRIV